MSEKLAELRAILTRQPSQEAWYRLLALLGEWRDDNREIAIDYATQHVDDWPTILRVFPYIGFDEFLCLPEESYLFRLCRIFRPGGVIGLEGARRLASNPRLRLLDGLDLEYGQLEDAGVRTLSRSTHANRLQFLDLSRNQLTHEATTFLLHSPQLRTLTHLNLSHNRGIGSFGINAFVHGRGGHRLRYLSLQSNNIGNEGIVALAQAQCLARLESLYLNDNGLRDDSIAPLLRSTTLQSLQHLSLAANELTDRAAALLADAPLLQSLQSLDLQGNWISEDGWLHLEHSPYLRHTTITKGRQALGL